MGRQRSKLSQTPLSRPRVIVHRETDNAVIGDRGVSDDHIDSRALDGKPIPDPSLHQRSIAEAIERSDQPWCSSPPPPTARVAFCGPMTDMIEDLSRTYGCRAEIEDRINAL